jgi:hypothetical protein
VSLAAGDYWVFVLANNGFDVAANTATPSASSCYIAHNYSSPFPVTFPGCTGGTFSGYPFNVYMVID